MTRLAARFGSALGVSEATTDAWHIPGVFPRCPPTLSLLRRNLSKLPHSTAESRPHHPSVLRWIAPSAAPPQQQHHLCIFHCELGSFIAGTVFFSKNFQVRGKTTLNPCSAKKETRTTEDLLQLCTYIKRKRGRQNLPGKRTPDTTVAADEPTLHQTRTNTTALHTRTHRSGKAKHSLGSEHPATNGTAAKAKTCSKKVHLSVYPTGTPNLRQ